MILKPHGSKNNDFCSCDFMRKCTGPREAQACFSRPRQGREGSGDVPQTTEEAALAADAPPISQTKNAKRVERSSRGLGMCPSKKGGLTWQADAPQERLKLIEFQPFLWRWAESNRRPNKAPEGFLHAYPAFDCRGTAAGGRANVPLASES